jgi:exodeoxyribonuclease VIII
MEQATVRFGMPDVDYHAVPAFSASAARMIAKAPALYREFVNAPEAPSPAMRFGTLVHAMVLEPDSAADRYVVAKQFGRTKAEVEARQAWTAECESRRLTIVAEDDWARAQRAAASVMAHPSASRLLAHMVREVSVFWTDPEFGIPCKARLDAWDRRRHIVADLKTCRDASPEGFGKAAWNFGYLMQAAHYRDASVAAYGDPLAAFVFIAVETERPHLCAAYEVGQQEMEIGAAALRKAKAAYADALQTGIWAGYSQFVEPLSLPGWAYRGDE